MEINYDICNVLDDKMMDYSAYVILHRALPSIEDGFKVSLRRILYTMHRHNMTKLTKSASVSGKVMEIHPHSDCYPTIVNMVQKDNHVNPFIIGKGAFAYHTSRDTQPASSRYSEVRIAPYSQEMMEGLKKNSVEMIPTFDGNSEEPLYLPTKHPNILTHSQQGMAVGMAANFPSFNLKEVCDCTIDYLNGITDKELVPDFATGGELIYNKSQIDKINNNGLGSIDIKARYEVSGDYILIKEIPYTTTREVIIEKIVELVKSNKLKEIVDIKDTTDLRGMEIEIKTKKNTDKELLMQKLYKLTPLQSSFSANMNCLVNNKPKVLGVKQIIQEWIKFRKQCLKRELQYDINSLEDECNKLIGVETILSDLDEAIAIIRGSKSETEAKSKLEKHFHLNQPQLDYICTIKLINMNEEWLSKKISKLGELTDDLHTLRNNINSDNYYTQRIISDLEYVKKTYGKPRMTTIIHEDSIKTVSNTDLIEEYNCTVVVTKQYIKKNLRYLDKQRMKDGDSILTAIQCNNKDKLLAFTDKGQVFTINVNDIQQCMPSDLGQFQNTVFNLSNECVVGVVKYEEDKSATLITQEGKCLVLPYSLLQGRKKQAISLGSKFKDNKLIYANEYSRIVTIVDNKNTKEYDVNFDYYSGRPSNGGNFILNCRNGKKVISEVFSC